MQAAKPRDDEAESLEALRALEVLDSAPEAEFDGLARAASLTCGTPIALISLVDVERQWFKANIGLAGVTETPREMAFCAHAVLGDELFEVPDAALDPRFADNPLVAGDPNIRFYAGAPVRLSDGHRVGTLCIVDRLPRQLTDTQREILRSLAVAAARALEGRRASRVLRRAALANEERLRRLYEATPAMLHSIDTQGRLLSVSDLWLVTLGYARDEVIGRLSTDFLSPASRAFAREVVLPAFFASGRCDRVAYQMVARDGSEIDVLVSATLERDDQGRPLHSLAVIEDVTLRRRAERALMEERQRLAHIIDGTGVGTWEWNVRTGELRINERFAQMLGRGPEDMVPATRAQWLLHMHPDDRVRSEDLLRQHLEQHSDRYACEVRLRHRDGHWVWVLDRGRVMTRDPDGAPQWMFGSRSDVSDRKRQEEALRKSEEFLDRTGRVAGVGGWELDVASGEIAWSDETRRIHGVASTFQPTLADAIGFYAPEAQPAIHAAVEHAIGTGQGWDLELALVRADGRSIWVRSVGAAEFADGKPVRLVGAFQDISERKRLEMKLKAALDEVRDLYDHAPCAYYSLDAHGKYLNINAVGLSWLGHDRDVVLGGLGPTDFFTDEGRDLFRRSFPIFKAEGRIDALEFDLISHDGRQRRVSMSATATHDGNGRFVMSRSVMHDITEMHRIRGELKQMNRDQAAMLDNELVGIVKLRKRVAVWKNKALNRIFGYEPGELLGEPARLLYPDDGAYERLGAQAYPVLRAGQQFRTQLQMRRKSGDLVWIDLSGVMLSAEDDESLWMMADITPMKEYQHQVEHIAFHDALTLLPNRLLLADRLNQALKLAQRQCRSLAVCYLDLDGFKQVNDRHGHDAGDTLLKEVARRLLHSVRASDTVARLGGDEFVVVLTPVEDIGECEAILQRLLTRLMEPVMLEGQTTARVAGSIGVALYPAHAEEANLLLALADRAMFEAKRAGRSQVHFHGASGGGR